MMSAPLRVALGRVGTEIVPLLAKALEEAGVAEGLPRATARTLAHATVRGSCAMLDAFPDKSPAELRAEVTSPGGTTEAAIAVLTRKGALESLVHQAVVAEHKSKSILPNPPKEPTAMPAKKDPTTAETRARKAERVLRSLVLARESLRTIRDDGPSLAGIGHAAETLSVEIDYLIAEDPSYAVAAQRILVNS